MRLWLQGGLIYAFSTHGAKFELGVAILRAPLFQGSWLFPPK